MLTSDVNLSPKKREVRVKSLAGYLFLLLLVFWCQPGTAITALQEISPGKRTVTVFHRPSTEPVSLVEISCNIDRDAPAVIVAAPEQGPWSRIRPVVKRDGERLSVLAMATAGLGIGSDSLVPCAIIQIAQPGTAPSDTDPLASIACNLALDADGNDLELGKVTMINRSRNRAPRIGRDNVQYRASGPIHRLSFNVITPTPVHAVILDMKGRTVRTLTDRRFDPGMHEVVWDGTAGGKVVSPRTYVLKFSVGTVVYTKKVGWYQ